VDSASKTRHPCDPWLYGSRSSRPGPRPYNAGVELDLDQLPIPLDWDLVCPVCGYPLRGQPTHCCSECGAELDMAAIVRPWHRLRPPTFTGRESPWPDFGLACRHCRRPLAGAVAGRCPHCGGSFDPEQFRPAAAWFRLVPAMHPKVPALVMRGLLAEEYVPCQFQGQTDPAVLTGQDGLDLSVSSEFYFDVLALARRAIVEVAEARASAASWPCPRCGEENPDHFDVCWNCQADRPAPAGPA